MQCVSTRQQVQIKAGVGHVFEANRAVALQEPLNADVRISSDNTDARSALAAVEEVVFAADATDAAAVAMELALGGVVVKQATLQARVHSKLCVAAFTSLGNLTQQRIEAVRATSNDIHHAGVFPGTV